MPTGPGMAGPGAPLPMAPAGQGPMAQQRPQPPAGATPPRPQPRALPPGPRTGSGPYPRRSGPTWGGSRNFFDNGPWGNKNQSWRPESWFSDRRPIFGRKGPSEWFDQDDYKDGLGDMWDDLLNAPSNVGKMPGGWYAPTISVPNPVDVGDEFENAMTDAPAQARDQLENFSFDGRDFRNPGGRPAGAPPKKPASWGTKATSKNDEGNNTKPK